jgi:hypothetical protein
VQDPGGAADAMQIAEVELQPYAEITSTNDTVTLTLPAGAILIGAGPTNSLLDGMIGGDANKLMILNDSGTVEALITPMAGASILKGFEFMGANDDAFYPGRIPSSVTIEGSNDGTNFVSLVWAALPNVTANMQIQGFSCWENTNSYRHYRALFGAPKSGNILQIGELRLLGVAPPKMNVSPAGNSVNVSWPATGFVLQQKTNVFSASWLDVTNPATTTFGKTQVIIPPSTGAEFYRLRLP